ncbi:AMP-binding enzyme [Selenihalanaerobacter shriftii]|uniref:AMP-binding enzyme n=1 Tax=Selenihalanaerobacter shriftii TaxID=142842 RepID=A0A1T4Q9X6_9FIRM|nr:AMP-binding enzyme [Selenihalanaerobacter shriftii]
MVPINIMYKPPAIEYILNNSEAKVLITSQEFLPIIEGCDLEYLKKIIIVEGEKIDDCKNLSEFYNGGKSYPEVKN